MSGDPEQEYFSDGISEDITTDLSKISALGVIARNTAFTFKGQAVDICDVAAKLGVSHVLEGSVRKAGGRVRINAQLINGDTGDHVWAERYDRELEDIFAIQDEISKAIVAALKLKLLPEEKKAIEKRGTQSAEAYNMYLLARQYWMTGNHGDARREERVMRICSRAVEIDPYYADAWALLAIAQSSLRYAFGRDIDDGYAAANAALAIDPDIPQARIPIIKRHQQRGNHDRAAAEMEAALRLGADSWEVNREAGRYFLSSRDVANATKHYERVPWSARLKQRSAWTCARQLCWTCLRWMLRSTPSSRFCSSWVSVVRTAYCWSHHPQPRRRAGRGERRLRRRDSAPRPMLWFERKSSRDCDDKSWFWTSPVVRVSVSP